MTCAQAKTLSSRAFTILDELHDQLCMDVAMVGGTFELTSAQINALRAALPLVLELRREHNEALLAAAREAGPPPGILAEQYPDDYGSTEIYLWPNAEIGRESWWRRVWRRWRADIERLGDQK
jgi:hypothetical protein